MDLIRKCGCLMKEVSLVSTARSRRLHVTASRVQAHIWYGDDYVATLCGLWLQVGDMHRLSKLADLDGVDGSVCSDCHGRYLHVR